MHNINRTAAVAESAINIRNVIIINPDLSQEDLMKTLKIRSEASLYSLLKGLGADPEMFVNGEFLVRKDGKRLTMADIDEFFRNNPAREKDVPNRVERLLYLYYFLHNAIPDGGLTFDAINNIYLKLFSACGRCLPKVDSLRRMIYRDMDDFRKLEIGIQLSANTKKYCLCDKYLPKLTPDSAATVYVSMLLYRDTLLDQATLGAKEQFEKAFFKGFPEHSKLLNERVYVLGDTLANPQEFGNTLGKLIRTVLESFRIKIAYINNEGEELDRLVEPLGLVCKRNVWYLIARKVDNNEYRTFRVDQILNLSVRDSEKFYYPPDFSLAEHIGCSWGVFNNDQVETVRLKFSPQVAFRVKNLHYHSSQRIAEECTDGSVILEFELCGLVEMQSWILQWGEQVEVLEPAELRGEIVRIARNIVDKYKSKRKRVQEQQV